MPELPEVETVCQGLTQNLKGRVFTHVTLQRKGLRIPFPEDLPERLKGKKVKSIERRAKYILINLEGSDVLIAHLGMTGRMIVTGEKGYKLQKHDHAIMGLDNRNILIFNDSRRFGVLTLAKSANIANHPLIRSLGIEPLSDGFTGKELHRLLKGRKTPVKVAIMDQAVVVGVGNIYASESLFIAGISPFRQAGKVNIEECTKLVKSIREILRKAIKSGGSTLRNYSDVKGQDGRFQFSFQVYDRDANNCLKCKGKISKARQGGRTTFYCNFCQN